MYSSKRKRLKQFIPPKEILIGNKYWWVKKAPDVCGDGMEWWAKISNGGCGAKAVWKMAGSNIEERDRILGNLSDKQIAEHCYEK